MGVFLFVVLSALKLFATAGNVGRRKTNNLKMLFLFVQAKVAFEQGSLSAPRRN